MKSSKTLHESSLCMTTAFSSIDPYLLAVGDIDGRLLIDDLSNNTESVNQLLHDGSIRSIDFTTDGNGN